MFKTSPGIVPGLVYTQWGMNYEEIVGSDELLIRLLEATDGLNQAVGNDIIIVPPSGELDQSNFVPLEYRLKFFTSITTVMATT